MNTRRDEGRCTVSPQDVQRDVDAVLKSADLCSIIRFHKTAFWAEETTEHEYCQRLLAGKPRLESVAEHSWHVADIVLLIAPRFPTLDVQRCLALAVLHDKLEIWCRDQSPLGRDGSGNKSFAFDAEKRRKRSDREREAADRYLRTLSSPVKDIHKELVEELLGDETPAARFVRAIDKLQVFVFLLRRKEGQMENAHIAFNLRYARKFVDRLPFLTPYYDELCSRLLSKVAEVRKISVEDLTKQLFDLVANLQAEQAELPFDNGI